MEIKKIAVIGAGTMGSGIAQTFAMNGYDTTVIARRQAGLDEAEALIKASVKNMLESDFITAVQAENAGKLVSFSLETESAAGADLVVEAVSENPEAKAAVFAKLDSICRKDCILTSTTSAMNIYGAVKVSEPGRLLIAHWNNPPQILPVVEIVAGPETDPGVIAAVRALLEGMDKKPVVLNRYIPGFICNRLNLALMRECSYMVEQGWITAEDVDTAFIGNQGMKAPFEGPLEMMDYIGWDVGYAAGQMLYPAICSSTEPSKLALSMIKEGRIGVKAGKGLRDYSGKTREEYQAAREQRALEVVKLSRKLLKQKEETK
jgi:3-hydroxybutyryl-CoA dehydrogenase